MQIIVSGIPVEIQKKNIKNMHLYVYPPDGVVRVSAPMRMSNKNIELFVSSKLGWIIKQREKFKSQERRHAREYVSGETLYIWGKQYSLRVEYSGKRNSMVISGDEAILTVRKGSTAEQRGNYVREWYRALLKAEVEKYLPKWEEITGLHASGWQSKYMNTRWGTCNTGTNKIWLNVYLATKPIECLEYVILHELAHTKVGNHGPEFTAILDEFMPNWRDIRKKLNG